MVGMGHADRSRPPQLTLWQRFALRRLLRTARKRPGDPLSPEDWEAYFRFAAARPTRALKRILRSLATSPRCGYCGAPFAGLGGRLVRPLGYRPSRKNPNLCAVCVELAPPGGMTREVGVLFADLRGFTALSEGAEPEEMSALLRRFYACATDALLPEALIDKLIGDEVMALYVPGYMRPADIGVTWTADARDVVAPVMLDHARELLASVGYGTPGGPFVEVGIGLAFGEVYLGNIGELAVHDFTAVGDVVNTASRLQGQARGGEVLVSARLVSALAEPPGEPFELTLEGKAEPVTGYRITASAS
jgi:adenylate cyclase